MEGSRVLLYKQRQMQALMTSLGYQPRPAETALPAIEWGFRKVWSGLTKLHDIQTSRLLVEQPPLSCVGRGRSALGALSWLAALGLCTTFVFTSTNLAVCLDLTPVAPLHSASEDQVASPGATYENLTLALAGTWSTVTSDGIALTLRIMARGPSTLVGRTPDVDRSQLYRLEGVYDDAKGQVLFKLTQPSTGFTRTGSLSLTGPNIFVGIFDQRADNGRQITWSGTRRAD